MTSQPDFALDAPLAGRVDQLAQELQMAVQFDRPAILLAVYRSEWVRQDAEELLAARLREMGQRVERVVLNPNNADLPTYLRKRADSRETVYFVSGVQFGGGKDGRNAYRALNYRREYFIDYHLRVVFWLTEKEEQEVARHAPDFWAFRHRVLVFLDTPHPEQMQADAKGLALRDWEAATIWGPDTAARIAWREGLLAELPETPENSAARGELLYTLAHLYRAQNQYQQAQELFQRAAAAFEAIGDSRSVAVTQSSLAELLRTRGQYDEAERLYRSGLAITQEIRDLQGIAVFLKGMGLLALERGNVAEGIPLLQEARQRFLAIGLPNWAADVEHILEQV
jgi:tetratricopeptide (TPR) repeat protein